MAIEKMSLAICRGKIDKLDTLLWNCCVDGNFHPEQAGKYISDSMGYKPYNPADTYNSVIQTDSDADEATDDSNSVKADNPYKPLIQQLQEIAKSANATLEAGPISDTDDVRKKAKLLISKFNDSVGAYAEEKRELLEQKGRCETGIEVYSNFIGLGVNIDEINECEFVLARFGRLPKESCLKLEIHQEAAKRRRSLKKEKLSENAEAENDNPYYVFLPCKEDATSKWGVYFVAKDKAKEVDSLFASLHFERVNMPGAAGTPTEIVENLKKDVEILDEQIAKCDNASLAFWNENVEECTKLYSLLTALDTVYDIKKYAVTDGDTFFFIGWTPEKNAKKFKKQVDEIEGVEVNFNSPEEDTTTAPPVRLKNIKLARPFEFFVDMYGLPSYDEIDITSFVAITYTIMFGIMFGDMGQGLILMIVGWLMWKLKKMALGKALVPCGASAMVFGFIYGSVFGYEEMLDPVYEKLGMSGKPLPVLENVNTILILAISIGILLVTISILINIAGKLKRKEIGEALFTQNGVAGLLFYLSAVSLAVTFMSKQEFVPSSITVPVLIACAVILFMQEILIGLVERKPDWKPESISDFIMQNIFELLEYVLSYASNTVSFLRVGAFVLVHAGMMMVVFKLAGDNGNIFVVLLGNALVICLEGLLTGIQAMRLEFYEMFSRFYEGEGRAFNAVKINKQ